VIAAYAGDRLLGPHYVSHFLRIAIPSRALRQIMSEPYPLRHQAGKYPVDAAKRWRWLTGSACLRVCARSAKPRTAKVIAGRWPYMAPGTNRRMNARWTPAAISMHWVHLLRNVDGKLPSRLPSDGWVHCHIARQPTPRPRVTAPGPSRQSDEASRQDRRGPTNCRRLRLSSRCLATWSYTAASTVPACEHMSDRADPRTLRPGAELRPDAFRQVVPKAPRNSCSCLIFRIASPPSSTAAQGLCRRRPVRRGKFTSTSAASHTHGPGLPSLSARSHPKRGGAWTWLADSLSESARPNVSHGQPLPNDFIGKQSPVATVPRTRKPLSNGVPAFLGFRARGHPLALSR